MSYCYRARGFTLLELVVVMVVIATLAVLAVLSFGSLQRDEALQQAAERIASAVELGAEEAALSGYPVGLDISNGGYEYQIYRNARWQALQRGRLIDSYEFDTNIDIRLSNNSADNNNEFSQSANGEDGLAQPTLVLLPDGERWLRAITLYDTSTDNVVNLLPHAGNYQIEADLR